MKYFLGLIGFALVGALIGGAFAIAQQPTAAEYTFKLNENEINVISKGLGTQPFAEVAPIMQKMQKQFIEQQPKPKPVDPAVKVDPPNSAVKE